MDGDELMRVIIAALIVSGIVVTFLAQAWLKARGQNGGEEVGSRLEQRLDRMERAIESVAVEVERIAEAHRFTAKLLAERSEQQAPPDRVATPR